MSATQILQTGGAATPDPAQENPTPVRQPETQEIVHTGPSPNRLTFEKTEDGVKTAKITKAQNAPTPSTANQVPAEKLLSAVERAIASVPPEPVSVSAEVIAENNRTPKPAEMGGRSAKKHWPDEILRDSRMVKSSPKTLDAILNHVNMGQPLASASPEALAKLREIESTMKAISADAAKYSSAEANKRFQSQTAQLTESVLSGNTLSPDVTLRSRDAVQADFRAKQAALVKMLVKLSNDAAEIAKPIIAEAKQCVEQWMQEREQIDCTECQDFGIEPFPSAVWQASAHLLMRLTSDRLPKPGTYEYPSRILAGVVTL